MWVGRQGDGVPWVVGPLSQLRQHTHASLLQQAHHNLMPLASAGLCFGHLQMYFAGAACIDLIDCLHHIHPCPSSPPFWHFPTIRPVKCIDLSCPSWRVQLPSPPLSPPRRHSNPITPHPCTDFVHAVQVPRYPSPLATWKQLRQQ